MEEIGQWRQRLILPLKNFFGKSDKTNRSMSNLIQIPSLVESNIKSYLESVEAITYPVFQSFGISEFSLPCILIKSGKFSQMEPATGVFEGTVAVSIISQIDEVADTLAAHDEVTGQVYDAMEGEGLATAFNTNGNLWFISLSSIDQDKQDRSLITILEYSITCQNLGLSS